ncbi:MAG: type II secretion system F family protein [Bacteroidia bacterium]
MLNLKIINDLLGKDISISSPKLSNKSRQFFYHEIGLLLLAGVDLKSAIELVISDYKKGGHEQTICTVVLEGIISGYTLSEAMSKTAAFTPYEIISVKIGEESGRLTYVLNNLSAYYQRKIKQKRQIINALTYPALVLTISFGAVYFLMKFIVPMFGGIFKRFGGELPAVTKAIISFSESMSDWAATIFILTFTLSVFLYFNREKIWFRKFSSQIILKVPIAGDIVRQIYLTRFCQGMSLLITAKLPLLTSIQLVRQMIGYYPIESSLAETEKNIITGKSLNKCLYDFSIYPRKMVALIKAGEEVNQLEKIFEQLYNQYNNETEHKISLINSLMEPVMIVFLGLIVGLILVGMYLPLFQLSSTIH